MQNDLKGSITSISINLDEELHNSL
jgi:hypothetical protein